MKNFTYCNPTKITFGKGSITRLSNYIPKGSHILLTYGGGALSSTAYKDQVLAELKDFDITPLEVLRAILMQLR